MTDSDPTDRGASVTAGKPAPEPPAFKDRKGGLLAFGVVLLLIALACLGAAVLQFVMLAMGGALQPAETTSLSPSLFIWAGALYLALAAGTAWLGIGSIRCRRWARALLQVLAAMALVAGIVSAVYLFGVFDSMAEQMRAAAGEEAATIVPLVMGCLSIFFGLVYFILPGAFFLFYRSPHVKATCEHHDPTPRWTDRYPAPYLGGIVFLFCAAVVLFAPLMGAPLPFFGALLSGGGAWAIATATGLSALALAFGFLRFERWAWIGALAFFVLSGSSTYLSLRGDGLLSMYRLMGYPQDQLDMMAQMGLTRGFSLLMLAFFALILIF